MKNASLAVLCYLRGNRLDKQGRAQLYLRITVNGRRSEFSLGRKVRPDKWCSSRSRVKGASEEAEAINKLIDSYVSKANKVHTKLVEKKKPFTADTIKNKLTGNSTEIKNLLAIYEEHNQQVAKIVGIEYSYSTYRRHVRTHGHLQRFIKKEYRLRDISIKLVDFRFVTRFYEYLKANHAGSHNTVTKYVLNFKKIVRMAFANGWIRKDPFYYWKAKWEKTEREILTEEDIKKLLEAQLGLKRLRQVKDIFLFSCFTGLSYIDIKNLTGERIRIGADGEKWITINRTKTKVQSTIPLLPIAKQILDKYEVSAKGKLLPVLSNQKTNAYLKEIATICGINKRLTFHLARHTFATTVTLSNGVPIESVSKMLGHTSLRTTQIYAKVIDKKLGRDMSILRGRYSLSKAKA